MSAAAALDSAPVIPLGAVPLAPAAPTASGPAPSVTSTVHTTPVLPQYHPVSLAAMLRAGKYQRVQRILGHIANCVSYVWLLKAGSLWVGLLFSARSFSSPTPLLSHATHPLFALCRQTRGGRAGCQDQGARDTAREPWSGHP